MGWTALLLFLSLARGAGTTGLEAPAAEAKRAAAELRGLADELAALRQSYAWERDGEKAARRREELRDRLLPALRSAELANEALAKSLRRYGSEHGLEALERLATGRSDSAPGVVSGMAAHTLLMGTQTAARLAREELALESVEWRRFSEIEAERRSYRRLLWALCAALAALLGFLAYALAASRRRRRGPITIIPR